MKNCLVTKLNGVVNNDSLDVLGHLKVKIGVTNGGLIILGISSPVKVILRSENSNDSFYAQEVTTLANNIFTMTNGGNITITSTDNNAYMEIWDTPNITSFKFNIPSSVISTKDFHQCYNLTSIDTYDEGCIEGDVVGFGNLINLTTLSISNYRNPSLIIGKFEDFVKQQRHWGRTVCEELYLGVNNMCSVKFNNLYLNIENFPYSGEKDPGLYASWTADTITINNVTINA